VAKGRPGVRGDARCAAQGPFYDLDIYIENDGQFTFRNTKGDFLFDNCCIPVDGKVTYRPPR
jgi:hypothetical protein